MSSYDPRYDSYDHRSSRRHDSFTRPQGYLSPTVSYEDQKPRRRSRGEYDSRRADERYYDRRRSPHSGPSSDDSRPRQHRQTRRTWPPAPSVESETRSLAREAGGSRQLWEQHQKEVPSRGAIDQDPVIEEVAEYANIHDRRFVMVSDSDSSGKIFTPPSSEDERLRKARRRPSRLQTEFNDAPELQKRTASPYAMAKPSVTRAASDAYLSPSIGPARRQDSGDHKQNRSPRGSPSGRHGDNYFDSRRSDVAVEDADDIRRPVSRDGSVVSLSGSEARRTAPSLVPAQRDTRRATDSSVTMPAPRGLDRTSKPSPLVVASALAATAAAASKIGSAKEQGTSLNPPTIPREPSLGSRNASPVSMASQRSASPPARSPRYSQEVAERTSSPESRRASGHSSRAGSRASSPPAFASVAMPRMPQMPTGDLDWNHLLATNAARPRGNPSATKQPTRLSTSMRAESTSPVVPRSAASSAAGRSLPYPEALPYPVETGPATPDVFMPAEQEHQWLPLRGNGRRVSVTNSERPPRSQRDSFVATSPVEQRPPMPPRVETATKATPFNTVGPTKQEADAILSKGLPGCPRPEPVANYDDWHTMIGASNLDFCPKCVFNVFEQTGYRKFFRRAVPRELSTKIACAFGNPWIRLAFLLTVQQRLPDLQMFKDLADIDMTSDPCPKGREAVRTWYGVRDTNGLFVRDFQICFADVRKLERLLPTFNGFFQRLPDRSAHEPKRCSLRAETNRFQQYINTIFALHEDAHARKSLPDPMPFIDLVERKLSLRECERDSLLLDSHWHYIPALPAFTVCEECFDEIVEPELKKGAELAKRFNRAVQPAYGETIGTSCQLYSPRMRKVFYRAVKENDLKYLTRKARERHEAEVRLQEKHSMIMRRLERYESRDSVDDEDSKRRLARDLRHITREWKEEWE